MRVRLRKSRTRLECPHAFLHIHDQVVFLAFEQIQLRSIRSQDLNQATARVRGLCIVMSAKRALVKGCSLPISAMQTASYNAAKLNLLIPLRESGAMTFDLSRQYVGGGAILGSL